MSLDVTLLGRKGTVKCTCQCGHVHNAESDVHLYSDNITHNLGKMAKAARIYEALWLPDEIGCTTAHQIAGVVSEGLARLKARPDHFRQFNSPNGWGIYEHFVPFVENYLNALIAHPDALIEVSR